MKTDIGNVIVSGGASGLGAAVARCIGDAGGTPIILDRAAPEAGIEHEVVDLADGRAAEAAVERVVTRRGSLWGVVTCAGVDIPGRLTEIDGSTWDRIVAVNLIGTAAVVRAALPALETSGGRVVTVASTLGLRGVSDATAYCASKFGVVGFTRALAAELAGSIGVTLLIPGGMSTRFFEGRSERYRPTADAQLSPPDDVARAVVFALTMPQGVEVRELVVCPSTEPSWP